MLSAHPSLDQHAALEKWMDKDNKAKCYILAPMSNNLLQQYEGMRIARDMLTYLQELYSEQNHTTRFEVS